MNWVLSSFGGSEKQETICFSLNLTDDQLAALAVQGMLPTWREKVPGQEFDNLGQLAQ